MSSEKRWGHPERTTFAALEANFKAAAVSSKLLAAGETAHIPRKSVRHEFRGPSFGEGLFLSKNIVVVGKR